MWIDELPGDAVDSASGTPLHRQLSAVIRASIAIDRVPAGTQLPTEAELQQKYGISRSVVRQALSTLTAEGLILRGRGRGSIVAVQSELHRLVQRISGLSTQMPNVRTEMVSLSRGRDEVAEAALGTAKITELRRLRSADSDPIALIETWLPTRLASTLNAGILTDSSLHELLRAEFGITIVSGRRQVRAVAASASIAATLRVPSGAPLLMLEGTSFDQEGEPIEYFKTWHRADRIVFDLDVVQGSSFRPTSAQDVAIPDGHSAESRKDRIRRLRSELNWLMSDLIDS